MRPSPTHTGTTIAGRYRIESLAAAGGMGAVYRARDPDGREVAVKVLTTPEPGTGTRLVREARLLRELSHPGVVRYLDAGHTQDGEPFLVVEWLDGVDLRQRLRDAPLALGEVITFGIQVGRALGAAHARGIVHRDVKPANIFLRGGSVTRAVLLDFGVALVADASQILTSPGFLVGTPAYMAPEQIERASAADARADVFALACVLLECLTGRPAFSADHPLALIGQIMIGNTPRAGDQVAGIPPAFDDLLARMLAREPAPRPADGNAVADELERIAAELDAAVAETSPADSRSHPLAAAAAVVTGAEQAVVSAVVAAEPRWFEAHATLTTASIGGVRTPDRARLLSELHDSGVALQVLPDGAVVGVVGAGPDAGSAVGSADTAADQAARAARYALRLRRSLPGACIAVATGRGVREGDRTVGEVMDRAVRLIDDALRAARADVAPGADADAGAADRSAFDIRLDETTAALVEPRFVIDRDAAGFALRGERDRAVMPPPRAPFVGRTRELAALCAALDECVQDSVARAVLVTAPAGIGKSRLLAEFLAQVRARAVRAPGDHAAGAGPALEVWIGHGDPMRAGSPLDMIAEIIRRAARIQDGEPLAVRQRKLRARFAPVLAAHPGGEPSDGASARAPGEPDAVATADRDRVLAFTGELIGTPAPDEIPALSAARRDPVLMSDHVLRACEDLLAAQTAAMPLVLVLEDLHWGDRATVRLADMALRKLADRPLLVVALARPEVHELFPRLWHGRGVTELALTGLARRAADKLARSLLGQRASQAEVDAIVRQADGNAFYLEELARAGGGDGGDGGPAGLPDSVRAMVQSRLAALPPEARRVLRAASVFGGVFWDGAAGALIGPAVAAGDWLGELEVRELVVRARSSRFPGQREYRFRHALFREAAYAMLTDADRARGHAAAGQWLRQAGEPDARVLAEHFERGGARARAARYYLGAAREALESGDLEAAGHACERAVACGAAGVTLGEVRRIQGELAMWRGDNEAAARCHLDAFALLPAHGRAWYHAGAEAIVALAKLGRWNDANAVAARVRAPPDPGVDADRGGSLVALANLAGNACLHGGRELGAALIDELNAAVGEVIEMAPHDAALVHVARAFYHALVLNPGDALREFTLACGCYEQIGNMRQVSLAENNRASVMLPLGMIDEAIAACERGLALADELSLDLVAINSLTTVSDAFRERGEVERALAAAERALVRAASCDDSRTVALAGYGVAAALIERARLAGDGDGSQRDLARAEAEITAALAAAPSIPDLHALHADLLLCRGRPDEALASAERGAALLDGAGAASEHGHVVRLAYIEALLANRRHDRARDQLAHARDRLLALADGIEQPDWREGFLTRVRAHARILALASRYLP